MATKDGMFRYADGVDKLLMLLGTLGSIGDGLQNPLTMLLLSKVINEYGNPNSTLSNDIVDKVCATDILLFKSIAIASWSFIKICVTCMKS